MRSARHLTCLCMLCLLLGLMLSRPALAQEPGETRRPNILICMADDWGWPHAGAYGDETIATPNFDRLAREGVLFTHAFATTPSCTAVRNSVLTGKHPWELGPGANLWSTLPPEHESFIHMLRDSGYITGRSGHKQWGPGRIQAWQAVHGDHPATGRFNTMQLFLDHVEAERESDDQPFFYWLAAHDPHRGFRQGQYRNAANLDPDRVQVFEHFPNVPTIREDIADYYFAIQRWDARVGQALATLEARGLLDNTIIIMTGDHGMPFPRAKGNLYDAGVRVPFAVRWGARVRPEQVQDGFVVLGDLGPTLLELAGVEVPGNMTMQSFAGVLTGEEGARPLREDLILGRERHTPAQGNDNPAGYPSRALRTNELLYIRNFEPDRWPAGNFAPSEDGEPVPFLADCDNGPSKTYIFDNRERDDAHRRAFELSFGLRPAEELYDLQQDPGQLHNLATDPAYADALQQSRERLQHLMEQTRDPRATEPNTDAFDGHPYFGGVFRR